MANINTTFQTFSTAARASSIGGTEDWGTESAAQTVDGSTSCVYSSTALRPWSTFTFYLTAKNMTDEVPAGATIDGIKITSTKNKTAGTGVAVWKDSAVYLIKGGTIQTTQNKASTTAYTTHTTWLVENHGGAADLWGLAWTADDVNSADFGVALSCIVTLDDGEDTALPQIDALVVEITYTAAVTGNASNLLLRGVAM